MICGMHAARAVSLPAVDAAFPVTTTATSAQGKRNRRHSPRVMWIASFAGAVIDGVSFVDCIFRGVRSALILRVVPLYCLQDVGC